MKTPLGTALASIAACLLLTSNLSAADWPQWRGPNRDGVSKETGLLKSWPAEGPKLAWRVDQLGAGYGAPSVVAGRVYLVSNKGLESESVKALDAKDGKELWSTPIGKVGNPNQRPNYPAARSTPTVDGAQVFVLGSDGDLACLDAASGKVVWQKSLRTDFKGQPGEWAYAESPLVDGDAVICMPGGSEATVVALNKKTGETLWKFAQAGAGPANYCSVIISQAAGRKHYVAFTSQGLVGLDPKTGKELWTYDRTKSRQGSIPTPVAHGDLIYSAANRVGGATVRVSGSGDALKAEEVYFDAKLPVAIGGYLAADGYLYGCSAQTLLCADIKTGEIKWSERSAAPGSVLYADGRLYLHSESGAVVLVEATPEAYREQGRFTPPNGPSAANQMEKTWAYPVLADGRLYLRNKDVLWSYDLKAR